jgi:DTW domain-containing protein YfiP
VQNVTPVYVLQHPREVDHPIGTVRFATLGLSRVEVRVARANDGFSVPRFVPEGAAVLGMTPKARPLSTLAPQRRPRSLLALDGTWPQARSLLRHNPWLDELPWVHVSTAIPGRYRIRREPTVEAMSTIEAIVEALRVLEPQTEGLDGLLSAFDGMIDRQMQFTGRTPRRRRSAQKPRSLPRWFTSASEVVVVHAETTQFGRIGQGLGEGQRKRTVVVAARALRRGETWSGIVRPEPMLPARKLEFLALPRARLEAGKTVRDVAEQLRAFVGDAGVVSWNPLPADLQLRAGSLKGLYGAYRARRPGALEDALKREALTREENAVEGRAGIRLGSASSLAAWLRTNPPLAPAASSHDDPR